MADQLDLFDSATRGPDGFKYQREIISPDMEAVLLTEIRALPLKEFDFHGYTGKRRTVSFGWHYDFSHEQLRDAEAMPSFLIELRGHVAEFAGIAPADLKHVLVTEYGANAGIGWHRDKSVFGHIVGVSLLSSCRFRLRRQTRGTWERYSIELEPRSAYLLTGSARTEWEHSIPAVDVPRYSITYRTLAPVQPRA